MDFDLFAKKLAELEATASRLTMTELLSGLYGELAESEIEPASYLLQGSLVPEYESLEFQLSQKMIVRALAELELKVGVIESAAENSATSVGLFVDEPVADLPTMTARLKKLGDIGELAQAVRSELAVQKMPIKSNGAPHQLTILQVFDRLRQIALESGQGSQQRKVDGLVSLLKEVTPLSARYLVRIVMGKLRLGFSTMTMLDALSFAAARDKSESAQLEAAFNRRADIGFLAKTYLKELGRSRADRLAKLDTIKVTLGVPVVPALCSRLNSASEIVEKMGEVYAEPKYDGLRVQIHLDATNKTARAFTRNLDDISHMFPELESAFDFLQVDQVILDGEAIGYDKETGALRAFQDTITRRRKHEVSAQAEKIPIRFYLYDLLLVDNRSQISQKLRDRKELLKGIFKDNDTFITTPFIISSDPRALRKYHEEQLAAGLEGSVMKKVDGTYISGRKGWSWVKIKEEEGTTGKLADTLDCLVMGYYFGRGKRAQFGLGALLVGLRDESSDQFKTIAKIGTGLSEEQLAQFKKLGDKLAVSDQPARYQVPAALEPDVWLEPKLVIEVAADELTRSPLHSVGKALRFPRLISLRNDKSHEQVTTIAELSSLERN